jgi:VIT1/CCC1 family predicted Fe2+/Mn2+ transporter
VVRLVFVLLVAALAVAAVGYVLSRLAGRPFASDTTGKVLVALIIAALAFWLFGGGAMLSG